MSEIQIALFVGIVVIGAVLGHLSLRFTDYNLGRGITLVVLSWSWLIVGTIFGALAR